MLGFALLIVTLVKLTELHLDIWVGFTLLLVMAICAAILLFGFWHLKRAFIGRHIRHSKGKNVN